MKPAGGDGRRSVQLGAGVVAVALVSLALGVAIGRSTVAASHAQRVTAGGTTTTSAATSTVVAPTPTVTSTGSASATGAPANPGAGSPWFDRTTADGVRIQAYKAPGPQNTVCPPGAVCPPPPQGCPQAAVQLDLSTPQAVQSVSELVSVPDGGRLFVLDYSVFGTIEGSPVMVVDVSAGSGVTRVRATFGAVGSDEMAPVGGLVALAHHIPSGPPGGGEPVSVEAFGPDGSRTADVAAQDGSARPQSADCAPAPPTLPAPGMPPTDPAGARTAIAAAFASLDAGVPAGQVPLVQDIQALEPTMAEAAKRANVPTQFSHVGWNVDEVVFTSPTEASVRYDITNAGQPVLTGQIGQVILENGAWVVSRATLCLVLAEGGTPCPP